MRTIYQPKDFSNIYGQLVLRASPISLSSTVEKYEFFERIYTVEINGFITRIYSDPKALK